MHSDGDIIEIMPDLVEAGVNMINPQYRANGIDRLVETCKGRYPLCWTWTGSFSRSVPLRI